MTSLIDMYEKNMTGEALINEIERRLSALETAQKEHTHNVPYGMGDYQLTTDKPLKSGAELAAEAIAQLSNVLDDVQIKPATPQPVNDASGILYGLRMARDVVNKNSLSDTMKIIDGLISDFSEDTPTPIQPVRREWMKENDEVWIQWPNGNIGKYPLFSLWSAPWNSQVYPVAVTQVLSPDEPVPEAPEAK